MKRTIPLRYNDYFIGIGTQTDWEIKLKPCERPPLSFHEELLNNARIIKNLSNGPINLMYSGGLDSEYILEILLSLGIDVKPIIIKLTPNYNDYDFNFAVQYCQYRKVVPTVIDINFDEFVNSGKFKEIASATNSPVYQYPVQFYAASKLDGPIIFGSDEPHFSLVNGKWVFREMERVYTITRWFEKYNIDGTPSFLNWSAETLLAYMNNPKVIALFTGKYPYKEGSGFLKKEIWNNVFKFADRDKKDGFEIIRNSPIFNHPDIQSVVSNPFDSTVKCNGYWTIEHSNLRTLLERNIT